MKQILIILSVLMSISIAHADTKVSGEKVFKKCISCHSFTKNKIGPNLGNIFGQKAGSVEGFKYSKAIKNSDIVWDSWDLDSFLKGMLFEVPGMILQRHRSIPKIQRQIYLNTHKKYNQIITLALKTKNEPRLNPSSAQNILVSYFILLNTLPITAL